jgi:hypothetical protein
MTDYSSIATDELVEMVAAAKQELARRPEAELLAAREARLKRREEVVAREARLRFESQLIREALAYIETRLAGPDEQRGGADHESPPADAAVPPRQLEAAQASGQVRGSDSSPSSEEAKQEPPRTTAGPAPARAAAVARGGPRDRDAAVLSAILKANRPVSKQQLADLTGLNGDQLAAPLKRLIDAGKVAAQGATKARRYAASGHKWHSQERAKTEEGAVRIERELTDAVGRVGLRDRVMKAVAADPAALDNNRLALALNAALDDVADATSWLVGKDRLQMAEDGTYLRSVAEAAREVAAA